jgi:sugar phosphate isomerase/epimerase
MARPGASGSRDARGPRGARTLPGPDPTRRDDDPLFRISLAQWSLHRALRAGELDALDFPRFAREELGLEAVEYVSTFYPGRATDFAYLERLRASATAADVRSLLIMVDGEGALADTDDEARRTATENHFRWIAAARFLGCHAIRVNAAGGGTRDEQRDRAADSLRRLGRMGDAYDVDVLVENHGGLSSNGTWLASVMEVADHPRVGTLPDFGNFRVGGAHGGRGGDDEWYDRYRGVAELMPFARAVSAKSHAFDAAGDERSTDYERMLRIVLDAGYRGFVGVEFEGDELSEVEGIRATVALLERTRGRLGAEYAR